MAKPDDLAQLVAAELAQPVDRQVSAMAAAIAARHPGAARAVLFYGSCLRERQLDGLMLDFYLIVSDYAAAYDRRWLATANRLIPPNVFHFSHEGLKSKYAVLSEEDFFRFNQVDASNVSVWARFSQPSRLVWTADERATSAVAAAASEAPVTLFRLTMAALAGDRDWSPQEIWQEGFARTYRAELRAEARSRPESIIASDPDRYLRLGEAVRRHLLQDPRGLNDEPASEVQSAANRRWRQLQRRGKWLSVARLAKAWLTFDGGVTYIATKIVRHSQPGIALTPQQNRYPIAAALRRLPALLRRWLCE